MSQSHSNFLFHPWLTSIAVGLLITETPLFKRYIANNWPLLSPKSGFVTLGAMMIIVGVSILGNLNKEATSQKSLGTPMWRIVIAAGILTSIFGIVNIFAVRIHCLCIRDPVPLTCSSSPTCFAPRTRISRHGKSAPMVPKPQPRVAHILPPRHQQQRHDVLSISVAQRLTPSLPTTLELDPGTKPATYPPR